MTLSNRPRRTALAVLAAAAALALAPAAAAATAAIVPGASDPTALEVAGTPWSAPVTLAPGFAPDPHEIRVEAGGNQNARSIGLPAGCVGWMSSRPDAGVTLARPFNRIAFSVVAGADTALGS